MTRGFDQTPCGATGRSDVRVEALADDDAVALPPVHLDGVLGVDGGEVVERCDQQPFATLRLQKFRQQRVGAHRLPAGVE